MTPIDPDVMYRLVNALVPRPSDSKAAVAEIERLRAAGDRLAKAHVDDLCDCYQSECVEIRAAHDAWQEARRG